MDLITLTQISGLLVGHKEDLQAKTGCTAILAPHGVTASVCCPGFAPGNRETDLLKPENSVQKIHGLCLSGGSAFGLSAASGVMRYLRENGYGLETGSLKVPLVPAAVVYDYPGNLSGGLLPDETTGYEAASAASASLVKSGPYGAGCSAMSGKVGGIKYSSPSGLGSFGLKVNGVQVAALAVVNPLGSIVDPWSGKIISGFKLPDGRLADRDEIRKAIFAVASGEDSFPGNTVLVVVATDASLTKLGAYRLAMMASTGLGRAVYPAHTMFDGDIVYALSTGTAPAVDPSWLGSLAADVVSQAIVNSVIVGK